MKQARSSDSFVSTSSFGTPRCIIIVHVVYVLSRSISSEIWDLRVHYKMPSGTQEVKILRLPQITRI